jgi:cell division protein FtsB
MAAASRIQKAEDQNSRKKEGALFQSRGLALLLAFFLFILVLAFVFGDHGILEIVRSQKEIKALRATIRDLEAQKEKLTREIETLRRNPLALEQKAREKLWLMKKSEKVVVLVPENQETNHE